MVIWLSIQQHCLKGERIKRGSGRLISHHNVMEHEHTQNIVFMKASRSAPKLIIVTCGRAFTTVFPSETLTCSVPRVEIITIRKIIGFS